MDRRTFIVSGICVNACCLVGYPEPRLAAELSGAASHPYPFEARFYEKRAGGTVQCIVCPNRCVIGEGDRGACGTRENRQGVLYSLVYGRIAAEHIDPIEKKPFYHVLPGSQAYSIATAGCNMWCKFCQNWQLSQSKPEDLQSKDMLPAEVAETAKQHGADVIAYTYNEPTVFNEFVFDCAQSGVEQGIRSVVVSNGYIEAEPLTRLAGVITAYKVDFKAFSKAFYKDVTGGDRDNVLATIKRLKTLGVWTELVHLTIPTLNDTDTDFIGMAEWIMGEIGPDIPVHFTRFQPMYRLTNLPVTPVSTLERARSILMDQGLRYIYVGNVPGHPANSTWCPNCGAEIISRIGFTVDAIRLENGCCSSCGSMIPGIWE